MGDISLGESSHPLMYAAVLAYDVERLCYITWQRVDNDSTAQDAFIKED